MATAEEKQKLREFLPDLPDYDPEPSEGVRVGESPVPGITLKRILRGHQRGITRMAWSPDGQYLASPSWDNSIKIWDIKNGKVAAEIHGHTDTVSSVSWSFDGHYFASVAHDGTTRIWAGTDYSDIQVLDTLNKEEYTFLQNVVWKPGRNILATGGIDIPLKVWSIEENHNQHITFSRDKVDSSALLWSIDGRFLAVGSIGQSALSLWNTADNHLEWKLELPGSIVHSLCWVENKLLAGSDEGIIDIINAQTGQSEKRLEAHTGRVYSLEVSQDKQLLVSKAAGKEIIFWKTQTWEIIGKIAETTSAGGWSGSSLAFHPELPILATTGDKETAIRIWEIDTDILLANTPTEKMEHYTAAKLVLVGESGVGKTGLGWRLAHKEFKEHHSTHGQQFWLINDLGTTRLDGTQCEAVLWDLAGQDVYRSVHAIFLDDVDMALLLFDPTDRQEPLKAVEFWLQQLKGKTKLPPAILIGARVDRGDAVLSIEELEQFCKQHEISGGYISTSAMSGRGIDELMELIRQQIPWEQMTTTVTTRTFKRIKDYVLGLKAIAERQYILVKPDELRKQLEASDAEWKFSDAEMMTAVGHLATHGYVSILRSSSGMEHILLSPDILASLAASIVMEAQNHPRLLGSISETELLRGKHEFQELKGLAKAERDILLDAAILRFVKHNICFRETLGDETLLIFPSLIKLKRPLYDDFESSDDVSYIVRGAVENVYAALVVLLGYTRTFTRVNQWQNQAQYEMGAGEICGFRQIEERAGEIELIIYYANTTPDYARRLFEGLFEQFLYQRDVTVMRYPPVYCGKEHYQARSSVIEIMRQNQDFLFCSKCGQKVYLPKVAEPRRLGERAARLVRKDDYIAQLQARYEAHLSAVKSFRRNWAAPRCYLSHLESANVWASEFTKALRDAGVHIVEDVAQVKDEDFILLLTNHDYKTAWDKADAKLESTRRLIHKRLQSQKKNPRQIVPLILEGHSGTACPIELREFETANFTTESYYRVALFEMLLSLYALLNHPAFTQQLDELHKQWENTLSREETLQAEIYISYAWGGAREDMVNELDTAFQAKGVKIIRDKRDLGYKGSIKEFMDEIGKGRAVILVISEKYLKSPNCCYELVQIAKAQNFHQRIFPIVLNDAEIYDPVTRIRYVQHWADKKDELDELMRSVSAANMHGFREDIDLYTEILALLPNLMNILKDMNTLSQEIHIQTEFETIFRSVMAQLEK